MVGDYIVVGIQTDPNTESTRVARVEGLLVPDANGQKRIQYFTSTYKNMDVVMGYETTPFSDETYTKNEIFCEPNFGPHPCNGLNGVFGSDFKSATNNSAGLWKLWLWLPEDSHASYFDYNLQQGDELVVWAGTYSDIEDGGTMFNTGYWQYGELITLSRASSLTFAIASASLIATFLL